MNLSCKEIDEIQKKVCDRDTPTKKICSSESLYIYHCGDDSGEVPPVLIPNTEVKLSCAESTWLDTAWEDM